MSEEFEIKKSKCLEVFYTGGDYQLNADESILFSTCNGVVKVLDVENGQERFVIGDPDDPARVTCFVISEDNDQLFISYNNGIIKQYRLHESSATLMHQFRTTHTGPILVCVLSPDAQVLFTGSSDYSVKVWNIGERICTHTLKGQSVVSALCLVDSKTLIIGYMEGQLRIYDISKRSPSPKDISIHSSRISAILFDERDPEVVYVVSRDQTLSIIDMQEQAMRKVLPLFEPIEAAVYVKELKQIVTVGGEGTLKWWNPSNGRLVTEKKIANKELDGVIFNKHGSMLVCSSVEQNLTFVDLSIQSVIKQLAGYNEEIMDTAFVSHEINCIAVATNSPQLRLYDLTTFNCTLVEGHTDLILGVNSAQWDSGLLATCSKDNTCLLWRISKDEFNPNVVKADQIGIATGHTNSISSVCFSRHRSNPFMVSLSKDSTLKLWSLRELLTKVEGAEEKFIKLVADSTLVAHSKDTTCVEVSENDKLCVTGSMDKTAKLWHIDSENMQLGIAGTLSGHKRGIWSAKFSNASQIVATGSGDCTIKLFSLTDLSCQMTLEGHSFAVLQISFINNASQLLSADSNGLIKMWTVKSGVCEKTVECHEDKIWTFQVIEPSQQALENLAKRKRKAAETETDVNGIKLLPEEHVRYVSAGSDSKIIIWEDITQEFAEEKARLAAERLAQIQTLDNFIRLEKYDEALKLTLTLDHPFQCYKLLGVVLAKGEQKLDKILTELNEEQLVKLLDFTSQWNTNTRTYTIGQSVLHAFLKNFTPKKLLSLPGYPDMVKVLLPYTKRHFDRLSNMQQDISFINYVTSRMEIIQMAEAGFVVKGRKRKQNVPDINMDDDDVPDLMEVIEPTEKATEPVINVGLTEQQFESKQEETLKQHGEKTGADAEIRKVPIPSHRYSRLKSNWAKITAPIVDQLKLQVRFNLKSRRVEIRFPKNQEPNLNNLQKAEDFVRAFSLGFDVDDAVSLIRLDHMFLESFEITDVKPLHGDHLSRAIGRIAGKDGRTKMTIENVTKTRIVLAGSKIHVLGSFINLRLARHTLCSLILGRPPSKVYGNLRNLSARIKDTF